MLPLEVREHSPGVKRPRRGLRSGKHVSAKKTASGARNGAMTQRIRNKSGSIGSEGYRGLAEERAFERGAGRAGALRQRDAVDVGWSARRRRGPASL
eukprot:2037661-Rhodomonas_salina.1